MTLPFVLMLHGLHGSDPTHWQHWLAGELANHGGLVDLPELPDPGEPQLDVWLRATREHLAAAPREGERVVVAHSLGCLLWLHHSAGEFDPALRVDRVLLVAPPHPSTPEPLIAGFLPPPLDPDALRRAAGSTRMVVGVGDEYISVEQARELAAALRIDLDVIPDGGHLNVAANYGSWPAVLKWVRSGHTPLVARPALTHPGLA